MYNPKILYALRTYMRYLIIFATLMLCLPATAAEDYYVWIDENGVTNYAERSPQGVQARHITTSRRFGEQYPADPSDSRRPGAAAQPGTNSASPSASATPSSSSTADSGVDPDAAISDERAVIAAQIAETKRKNCEIGKKNLASLEAFARIRVKGEDGTEHILTPDEKAQRIETARQVIKENCSG